MLIFYLCQTIVMMNLNIDITKKQRNEIERIVTNWTNYLESVPPTSDAVKVHRCFGANSSIVRKDDFNKKLRTVVDEMRVWLDVTAPAAPKTSRRPGNWS